MGTLTEQQIKIREQIITEFANMGSMGECPYCHRTYLYGKERAERMATENNKALNALVAALYESEPCAP